MLRARRAIGWALAVSVAACGSATTELEFTDQLIGTWLWVDATGGIAGETRTPSTEGYQQSLRFYDSSEVELFRNGVSQLRTDYTHVLGEDGGRDNLQYGQDLFGFPWSGVEIVSGDMLLLYDPCCDGFVRRWVR